MPPNDPQDQFRKAAKKAMIDRDLTITRLAKKLGFARNTVSMAINKPLFPSVRRRIIKELDLDSRVS